jgi:hypothetical protein
LGTAAPLSAEDLSERYGHAIQTPIIRKTIAIILKSILSCILCPFFPEGLRLGPGEMDLGFREVLFFEFFAIIAAKLRYLPHYLLILQPFLV